jgi:hypothetical protein
MIHIDFGFIFDISPANNLKFESAGFKLTLEMLELMGSDGKTASPLVCWFQELVIRGFLAVREHRAEILAIVEPMLGSTLVCFKPNSLAGLKSRFFPDVDEKDAAVAMLGIVNDAWNKWSARTQPRARRCSSLPVFADLMRSSAVVVTLVVRSSLRTTNVYDMIQKAQQGVFFFPGTSAADPEKKMKRNQDDE